MLVTDINVDGEAEAAVLSARIVSDRDRTEKRVEYRFHGCPPEMVSTRGDAFVAAMLIPAMWAGEDLTVDAPVSPLLIEQLERISDILLGWRPALARAKVFAPALAPEPTGQGIGLFFSGGVDSYHSLLRNIEEEGKGPDGITHLIFGFGIDTRYGYDEGYVRRTSAMVRDVAQTTGKQPIILETNLRADFGANGWMLYHGSALISIALTLNPVLRRCLVASSWMQDDIMPWGSHPDLDPLWSTETVEIVHDGIETLRGEKVSSQIARSDLALRTLRVCFKAEQQPRNCGRCPKCLQTMIGLHTAGVLDKSSTFDEPLSIRRVYWMGTAGRRKTLVRRLAELGDSPYDRRIRRALRFTLWRDDVKQTFKRVLPNRVVEAIRPGADP